MKSNNKYNGSNEYQKAIDFLKKGCNCGCSSGIPKEQFAELRESFQAVSKSEQDVFLMPNLKPWMVGQ
jgi:thiaminase